MSKLIINGQDLNISELLSGTSSFIVETEFESSVIAFIKSWEQGTSYPVSTSGSTGPPKIVNVRKTSMEQSAHMTAEAIGLKSGMNVLLAMDTNYIAGKMMIARALTLDLNLIAVEPSSNPFRNLDSTFKIDFAAFVPMQMTQILRDGHYDQLNGMHTILVGGGPVSQSLAKTIETLEVPVYHSYGMTETITHIALRRLNGESKGETYKLLPGIKMRKDDRGCLVISGGFLEEEVVTNDLMEIVGKHEFRWLGRIDNVINSGGIKLHPEVIEPSISELLESIGLRHMRFFLAGLPDESLGERMVLFVEGYLGRRVEVVDQLLKTRLESYQSPKEIIELDRFEETETGKLKRGMMIDNYIHQ